MDIVSENEIDLYGYEGSYKVCARCDFYERLGSMDEDGALIPYGACVRYPPEGKGGVINGVHGFAEYPTVCGYWVCGEFRWNEAISVCRNLEHNKQVGANDVPLP